jgi:dipeptidyl aminopeptidase/acylaminoacyl peptidase
MGKARVVVVAGILLTALTGLLTGGASNLGQAAASPKDRDQVRVSTLTGLAPGPGGLAFTREEWIYYLPPGGKEPRRLLEGRYPALSPDGQKLAYGEVRDGGWSLGLMVLDLAGARSTALIEPGEELIAHPEWSPQGDRLAFLSLDQGQLSLDIIQADGTGRQKVFIAPLTAASPHSPVWAPDGRSLTFHDLHHLYQISLTGEITAKTPLEEITGKAASLSSLDRFVRHPAAPQLMAFTMGVKGTEKFEDIFDDPNSALFLYDLGTKERIRLTPPDMLALHPSWARDGQYLYFCGYREPHYQENEPFRIYRISKDGGDLQEITRGRYPSQASGRLSRGPRMSPGL